MTAEVEGAVAGMIGNKRLTGRRKDSPNFCTNSPEMPVEPMPLGRDPHYLL